MVNLKNEKPIKVNVYYGEKDLVHCMKKVIEKHSS